MGSVPEIKVEDVATLIKLDAPIQILDVRTRGEWKSAHIKGAINVPITQLKGKVGSLPFNKQDPIVAICLSAHRSIPAVRLLKRLGYKNVKQLKGGMRAWNKLTADEFKQLTNQRAA